MKGKRIALTVVLTLAFCLAATGAALAMSSSNYDLPWTVLSGGGGDRSSTSYTLGDTVGQPATGPSESASYRLGSGFWYGITHEAVPAEWSVPMTATTDTEGNNLNLEFGVKLGATDSYDSGIDIPYPGAPPGGFDAYFSIVDTLFPQLDEDYRAPADSIQWTLHAESSAEDITLTWDASSIPAELSAYMDTGISVTNMKSQDNVVLPAGVYTITISVSTEVEILISLKAGWNMVSVPVIPQDTSVASVFAGTEVVYTWNPATKSYYSPTDVEPDKGYFVAVLSDMDISVLGVPVYSWTTDITAGWNMGGSVFDSVSFTDPQDDPDSSVEAFAYWWDPVIKSYYYVTIIEPKKGHWIAATQNCTLTLLAP